MSDAGYLISEAAKLTEVDAHVLRYWEEELELPIMRNRMGHRYYTREDIQTFQDIKELKKKGLQLRAIREVLHQRMEAAGTAEEGLRQDKLLLEPGKKAGQALLEPGKKGEKALPEPGEKEAGGAPPEPAEQEQRETQKGDPQEELPAAPGTRQQQFQEILERLVRQVILANRQEGRYKRLDAAIRRHQESRRLVAATEEGQKKKRNGKKVKNKNRSAAGGKDR